MLLHEGTGFDSVVHADFPIDVGHVALDRPRAQEEPLRDLAIAQARRDETEHLDLAGEYRVMARRFDCNGACRIFASIAR